MLYGVFYNRRYENKYSIKRSVRNGLQLQHPVLFAGPPAAAARARGGLVPAHATSRPTRGGLDAGPRTAADADLVSGTISHAPCARNRVPGGRIGGHFCDLNRRA